MSSPAGAHRIIADSTIAEFLVTLASDSPTPGGGAVAAICGAAGAALISMVCRLTIGREAYEDVQTWMQERLDEADAARSILIELADRDARAFDAVMDAFKMPKADDRERAERSAAIQRAYEGAARVPLEVAGRTVALMELAAGATERGNANAASDALSAAHVLHAAAHCALANVAINVAGLKDETLARELQSEIDALRASADERLSSAQRAFAARLG